MRSSSCFRRQTALPCRMTIKTGRVIEKRIKDLGEVSDLPPGKSGSLTVQFGARQLSAYLQSAEPL